MMYARKTTAGVLLRILFKSPHVVKPEASHHHLRLLLGETRMGAKRKNHVKQEYAEENEYARLLLL